MMVYKKVVDGRNSTDVAVVPCIRECLGESTFKNIEGPNFPAVTQNKGSKDSIFLREKNLRCPH